MVILVQGRMRRIYEVVRWILGATAMMTTTGTAGTSVPATATGTSRRRFI